MTCSGYQRFTSESQAEYVAEQTSAEFDTRWVYEQCGDHWHVFEVGDEYEAPE